MPRAGANCMSTRKYLAVNYGLGGIKYTLTLMQFPLASGKEHFPPPYQPQEQV